MSSPLIAFSCSWEEKWLKLKENNAQVNGQEMGEVITGQDGILNVNRNTETITHQSSLLVNLTYSSLYQYH